MFAPNVVGTANAASAGWGNAGGGATQVVMPWLLAALVGLGAPRALGWRLSLLVPAALMLLVAIAYFRCTRDSPRGDFAELRRAGVELERRKSGGFAVFAAALRNYRSWILFATYAASFGVELFVHNVAASYYVDRFGLDLASAGLAAGSFGLLALSAACSRIDWLEREASTRGRRCCSR